MTIIVTGLGRCGSSLTMQMLDAAGISVAGEPSFFEHPKASVSNFDPNFVGNFDGAVKVLALHHCGMPKGNHKIIYCYRDSKQQAASQKKFYEHIHSHNAKKHVLSARIRKESALCLRAAKKIGPVLSLRFEDFFGSNRVDAIGRICHFLNIDPEKSVAMYNCVIERPPECMPDLQVERMLT